MAIGPGKYDDVATEVRTKTHAEGVVVIVIGGHRGEGFAAQLSRRATRILPNVLRAIADQIEADDRRLQNN